MPDDATILDWLGEVGVANAVIQKILVDNPEALYGFDN